MENKGYADFWGANKMYYGECGNGEFGWYILPPSTSFFKFFEFLP